MKKISTLLITLLIVFTMETISAQRRVLNNRQFEKKEGQWYRIENGNYFQVNNSVITVKFNKNVTSKVINSFNESQRVKVLRENFLKIIDLKIPDNSNPLDMVDSYLKSNLIEFAEVNTIGKSLGIPNDNYFSNQWHHEHEEDNEIDTPFAWEIETGSSDVIIAVLDVGTDIHHEDLKANIWVNPGEDINNDGIVWDINDLNGIDDDGNGRTDDLVGWNFNSDSNQVSGNDNHGTHVAGVFGAVTNNNSLYIF